MTRHLLAAIALPALVSASTVPAIPFTDLATPFDDAARATLGQPIAERTQTVRARIDALLPGIYPDDAGTRKAIADALEQPPATRAAYQGGRALPRRLRQCDPPVPPGLPRLSRADADLPLPVARPA